MFYQHFIIVVNTGPLGLSDVIFVILHQMKDIMFHMVFSSQVVGLTHVPINSCVCFCYNLLLRKKKPFSKSLLNLQPPCHQPALCHQKPFIVKVVVKQEQYCPRAKSFIGTLLGLHCISLAEWRSYGDPPTFIFCFVGHHHHQPALSCHHPSGL